MVRMRRVLVSNCLFEFGLIEMKMRYIQEDKKAGSDDPRLSCAVQINTSGCDADLGTYQLATCVNSRFDSRTYSCRSGLVVTIPIIFSFTSSFYSGFNGGRGVSNMLCYSINGTGCHYYSPYG
jgi:hypothetical protein